MDNIEYHMLKKQFIICNRLYVQAVPKSLVKITFIDNERIIDVK